MKLNVKALAMTSALVWGLGLFCLTWWIILFEGATGDQLLIGHVYRGYDVSPVGSLIGLAWGLVDGYIGGWVIGWLYNKLAGGQS